VPLDRVGPEAVRPAAHVLRHLPVVELDEAGRAAVLHGQRMPGGAAGQQGSGAVVLLDGAQVVAVAESADGWLQPIVVLGTS
jgi:hypothetical protein